MANKRPITTPATLKEHPDTDSLIAGQGTLLAEQAASLGTPSSGYGVIYAKTDNKVYFKNDAGTEYDLTAPGGGGSGTNPIIREYIANATWTKPTASNFWGALVVCVGAGGGGGSGRRGAAGTPRGGGSGGGAGSINYRLIRAAQLTAASYAIVIGSGGTGGASQTTDNSDGNIGLNGGITTFQSFVTGRGGNNGLNGQITAQGGGQGGGANGAGLPASPPNQIFGGNGSNGTINTAPTPSAIAGFGTNFGNVGGTGGSCVTSGNIPVQGAAGGSVFVNATSTTVPGGTAGSTSGNRNGGAGTDNAHLYLLFDTANPTTYGVGTSGGSGAGGDAAGTIAGGNAGSSGKGAGGSGGGGSTNGANSGAGANGGNGLCFVVEYYGA